MHTAATPPNPPQLTVGTHLAPADGACLMEWVSVLAGQPWSDAPPTTHPLLAHLGRLVNDAMSPAGRQDLAPLAPRLAKTTTDDPDAYPDLAVLATSYALGVRPGLHLAWMQSAAQRQLRRSARSAGAGRPRTALSVLRQRIYRHGPAHRAVEAAVTAVCRTPDADRHLRTLLEEAMASIEASGTENGGQGAAAGGWVRAALRRSD